MESRNYLQEALLTQIRDEFSLLRKFIGKGEYGCARMCVDDLKVMFRVYNLGIAVYRHFWLSLDIRETVEGISFKVSSRRL